jgi:hypothetical protein
VIEGYQVMIRRVATGFFAGLMLLGSLPLLADREISKHDFSGWLDDYESLSYVEERNAFVFFNEARRNYYSRVQLDSVVVFVEDQEVDTTVANEATQYLTTAVNDLLLEQGIDATEPAQDVLTLRLAITGAENSKEDLKPRNFIPVAAVFRTAQAATGKVPTYIDTMFEAEMRDSLGGDRVAAVVVKAVNETEKRSGDDLQFEDIRPTLDAWVKQFQATLAGYLKAAD